VKALFILKIYNSKSFLDRGHFLAAKTIPLEARNDLFSPSPMTILQDIPVSMLNFWIVYVAVALLHACSSPELFDVLEYGAVSDINNDSSQVRSNFPSMFLNKFILLMHV